MRRAKERDEYIAKRAERAVVQAARSLAGRKEPKAAEPERGRGRRATTRHTHSVELARDETTRLRGFATD